MRRIDGVNSWSFGGRGWLSSSSLVGQVRRARLSWCRRCQWLVVSVLVVIPANQPLEMGSTVRTDAMMEPEKADGDVQVIDDVLSAALASVLQDLDLQALKVVSLRGALFTFGCCTQYLATYLVYLAVIHTSSSEIFDMLMSLLRRRFLEGQLLFRTVGLVFNTL